MATQIPKLLFQTWKTTPSPQLQQIINTWKTHYPDHEYTLHDDAECDTFIKTNFDARIYAAYSRIIPGAFKADLWRACVLYIHGGIYADVDTICTSSLQIPSNIEFVTPIDLNQVQHEGYHFLFNTFIATIPRHPILLGCIARIVNNIETGTIPSCRMDFSGPGILGQETNRWLGRPLLHSFIGQEGLHPQKPIYFLKFEPGTEYVRDMNGSILFQNKNGSHALQNIYNAECHHQNTISWVHSQEIIRPLPQPQPQPKWIAPRLFCGLGNRLFQMATAASAAARLKTEAVFFLPRMGKAEHGNFDVMFKLFPTIRLVETAPEWQEIHETSEQIPQPFVPSTHPIVLHGFFQNCENFPDWNAAYMPRLPGPPAHAPAHSTTRWAVHFRFGDYLILPHHQIPDMNRFYYYQITCLPKQTPLTLFSDSPERLPAIVAELATLGYTATIFDSKDVLATFQAFAACQGGAICSNSTFSWWAAYFAAQQAQQAQSPTYKAYFPDKWLPTHPSPNLFKFPFTQSVNIENLPAFPVLKSFTFR